jgi:hypothetical protein
LTADAVHVLFGSKLRHFVTGTSQAAFRELAPLVSAGRGRALAFDVLSAGGGLVVAYLLEIPAQGSTAGALELHVAGGAGLPDRTVARFPASVLRQPSPRLVVGGGRLHLLCAVNQEERRTTLSNGRKVEEMAPVGAIFYLGSGDGGETWTQPVEVAGGRSRPPVVQAVELMARPGSLIAVYSAFGLWAARSPDGRAWSAPVAMAPYATSLARGSTESGAVAAAPGPDGSVLAWIDARFQKSDRRWWNPLGGVPWSDDNPLWANNDIFVLRLPEVEAALAGRPVAPHRLTSPLSSARSLRAGAAPEGRAILLWAGRRRVGKQPDTFHEPPVLLYVRLP